MLASSVSNSMESFFFIPTNIARLYSSICHTFHHSRFECVYKHLAACRWCAESAELARPHQHTIQFTTAQYSIDVLFISLLLSLIGWIHFEQFSFRFLVNYSFFISCWKWIFSFVYKYISNLHSLKSPHVNINSAIYQKKEKNLSLRKYWEKNNTFTIICNFESFWWKNKIF